MGIGPTTSLADGRIATTTPFGVYCNYLNVFLLFLYDSFNSQCVPSPFHNISCNHMTHCDPMREDCRYIDTLRSSHSLFELGTYYYESYIVALA